MCAHRYLLRRHPGYLRQGPVDLGPPLRHPDGHRHRRHPAGATGGLGEVGEQVRVVAQELGKEEEERK